MVVGIWILVIIAVIFIFSVLCNEYDKCRFMNILTDKKCINLQVQNWLIGFSDRIGEKNAEYYFNSEGKIVRSRLWAAWKQQTEVLREEIKIAKIFFGTNILTPIEEALPKADKYIKGFGNVEDEILFWKTCEKLHLDDEDIKECYSEKDVTYIINKIKEYKKTQLFKKIG